MINLRLINQDCSGSQLLVDMYQGETGQIIINFPYDVSNMDFVATIDFPDKLTLNTDNGGIEVLSVSAELSRVAMNIATEDTQDVAAGQYPFDFWTTRNIPPVQNLDQIFGYFQINQAVTRIS